MSPAPSRPEEVTYSMIAWKQGTTTFNRQLVESIVMANTDVIYSQRSLACAPETSRPRTSR